MKPNPGGEISPSEVLGRDELIQHIWTVLEGQSVVLTAERRIGKTSILKKMMSEPQAGKTLVFRDLENIHTPLEFAECIFEDVETFLPPARRAASKTRRFLSSLGSSEIKGFKLPAIAAEHWKAVLRNLATDLDEYHDGTLIFLWDEIPMMLENIRGPEKVGERLAMEVLDTLRQLRQTFSGLRMIYTGSIGLHHVLTSLRRSGYANAPVNDMYQVEVPPISEPDAVDLARRLMEGAEVSAADSEAVAAAIAQATGCIPFYVHHIVRLLGRSSISVTPATVEEMLADALIDPHSSWHLFHYVERIETYYGRQERLCVLAILDGICQASEPLTFGAVVQVLRSRKLKADEEEIRHLLQLLQRDHYLNLNRDGGYRFSMPLVERFWRVQRGGAG